LLFGYSQAEAIGQSLNLIVPEKYQPAHWAAFRRAMQEGHSRIDGGAAAGVSVQCKDGEVRPYTSRFHLLKNGLDQTIGAMTIFVGNPDAS
jgi:PAS domain S-box-containing protein